jgi:ectoine hydroxylase-related dioxygenase (phytanoyl-CoA dioxygenase family)
MGGSDTATYLREMDRQHWERDGYLRFDPACSPDLIDAALDELESLYIYEGDEKIEDGVHYSPGSSPRIRNAWKINENIKAIALLPKVIGVLRELYGREPLPFQTLNFPIPTQQAPHSDAMHFNTDPPGSMCGVWIAFEDIDMDNGPLVYYPGSHRLPFARYADVGFDAEKDDYPSYADFIRDRNRHYEQYVARQLDEHGLAPEYGTINKGEAIIWSANLLHGGTPKRDSNRTRHSQVTHYLFEGVTGFFTEMQTEGEKRVWKEPDWIT